MTDRKCLAVVRVRGVGDAHPQVEKTLELLHLTRNCHITLIDDRPSFIGMLKKITHFVTWGEITKDHVYLLFNKRGKLMGNKKVDDEYAQRIGFKNLKKLAEAAHQLEVEFSDLPDMKPVFRAHPPRKGYKGKLKRSYTVGGVTGYRGEAINKLIEKMA